MSEQEPVQAAQEQPMAGKKKLFDRLALAIIVGCLWVAMIIIGVMYSGYSHTRNSTLADQYYNAKQYEQAEPYLKAIIHKYPEAWIRIKMLGDCYLNTKHYREAMDSYLLVMQSPAYQVEMANPNSDLRKTFNVTEELGMCAAEMGNMQKANEYFKQVPESPVANYYQGVQYYKEGRWREAAKCFQNCSAGSVQLKSSLPELDSPDATSKWGDRWDKLAKPYRQQIAKQVLGPDAPRAGAKG